ncbi:MAG TPA: iron-containing redox enzyme family protein [Nitrososphaeraceae archaeon]
MEKLVKMIDKEIQKRSLLKHPFYQMWSKGELNLDHLQGYSKEYFSLVKTIPKMVGNIASLTINSESRQAIEENRREESEHIRLWKKFVLKLGVPEEVLFTYNGATNTNKAVSRIKKITTNSFEEGICSMYAYEMELPKISRSKIDGLELFYNINDDDALEYFRTHEEVDVRHAQVWRDLIDEIPRSRHKTALNAAIESLKAQNELLDSVYDKYIT